jgi:hypothetical protein
MTKTQVVFKNEDGDELIVTVPGVKSVVSRAREMLTAQGMSGAMPVIRTEKLS